MLRTPTPDRRRLSLLLATPLILAACATAATEERPVTTPEDTISPPLAASPGPVTSAAPVSSDAPEAIASAEPATETAAWLGIELIDAASGEPFTLASLQGEVVAIEPMAVWCSNCRAQQDDVKKAFTDIKDAGVRYISLGVDPGEDPATLAGYAERRGYDWTFATSPRGLSRALRDLFGAQILSPPSTPLIVLDAEGEVVVQTFGRHSPSELLAILAEAGAPTT